MWKQFYISCALAERRRLDKIVQSAAPLWSSISCTKWNKRRRHTRRALRIQYEMLPAAASVIRRARSPPPFVETHSRKIHVDTQLPAAVCLRSHCMQGAEYFSALFAHYIFKLVFNVLVRASLSTADIALRKAIHSKIADWKTKRTPADLVW